MFKHWLHHFVNNMIASQMISKLYILRNILIVTIFTIFFSNQTQAQPRKGKFMDVSIGLGISAPFDDVDISGSGFYAQGEYVYGLTKWFGVRPYAGFVFTSPDKSNKYDRFGYKVTSSAFLFGAKTRVSAPIPWIAPYFEIGVGASTGTFVTYTPYVNIEEKGLLMHIPFSIGLALGRKHNYEIAFKYYYHPSVKQFSGAAAFGFSFPLD